MNKAMMKWVLTQQEPAALYDLANVTDCKVKGFREITRANIKQVRSQVIHELQKPAKTVKLKVGLYQQVLNTLTEEVVKELREKKQDELLELIDTKKYSPADVLLALITGEAEQLALAEALFQTISEQETMAENEPQADSQHDQEKEQAVIETAAPSLEPIVRELEEQLAQAKDKAAQLEAALKELREKRKTEAQEWKKERKGYTEEIKALRTELEHTSGQAAWQEAVIAKLQAEVIQLQEEVTSLTEQAEMKTAEIIQPPAQPASPTLSPMKVVLVGEYINESILDTPKFDIELVSNNQIEDLLRRSVEAEEIWMLSFQISPSKQRRLRNACKDNSFKEFATLVELQSYINKK
ncbi:hypothetical protein [Paenibacillus xylaniclasticus]|uniref:hypothetical protein n=1 Tax=Paenibacillus xylaniclasticus TaxID=588083 RepID=UPI000FDCAB47|nr:MULTISPECIES: hypothetical protein [Paenibacillus]GFN32956.1 hypothetical protein PCURB6_32160 [Paenibacillus curdlanolyticus]